MRTRKTLIMVAVLFAAATLCYAADDANMGTWKLNEGKTKLPATAAKNSTVVYSADGDNVKVAIDGTTADGKSFHSDWTGKFDGKDYAVTGDPNSDMRSYTRVNANTLTSVAKKDGKQTGTARIMVAPDGKSRTVTFNGMDAKGKKISFTAHYDKE